MNTEPTIQPLPEADIRTLFLINALEQKQKVNLDLADIDSIKSMSEELAKVKSEEDKKLAGISKLEEQAAKLQTKLAEAYKTLDLRLLYMSNTQMYYSLTGTAPEAPAKATNGKKASDNPDQEAMLEAITKDNIKEAINSGVDSSSNADILKWLAKEKLGKEEIQLNQSLRTKVYSIRKSLGY